MKLTVDNSFKKFCIERKERESNIRKGMWDERKV